MITQLIKSKQDLNLEKIKDVDTFIIDADEKITRSILESFKSKKIDKKIIIFGRDNNFNRRIIEGTKILCLLSPEREIMEGKNIFRRKDSLKQRDSGLNHVVAKEAVKKGIAIGIDFQEIKNLQGKEKATRLARIMQNIIICRKAKCKILILDLENETNKQELLSFAFSLGMSSQQAKEAITD
jgi:hypothetical protein